MYDLVIIGGGPAGVSAGVYAARKRLKTVLVAEKIGGQSFDSNEIQNWIGTEKITGQDLAKAFEGHLRAYASQGLDIHIGERVEKIEKTEKGFSVKTNKSAYDTRAILIATGGFRKQLEIPGAKEYENKGLTYCASCDGPLFADQDTIVVGGGNAGFETAAQLLAYAKSVTLLHRGPDFSKADASTVEAVLKHPNMKALTNTAPIEIKGGQFVQSIVVKNTATGKTSEIPAAGIFVEIGMVPSTDLAKGVVELNEWARIKVDPRTQRTSTPGIWAAGDSTDGLFHQNNIAAGDAVKALEDIYLTLHAQK
ncbi:MAG: Alkyl hydroperoxide reductase [Parcubacteria group bacterium Gr01-1014_8]|nr:MAG: Alkyl hydroperoxide reductase [Parcubacteria group bacterium Gr01-1014_8]